MIPEGLTLSEAVSLVDTARPAFAYGLFLLPAAFVAAATEFVARFVLPTITLPRR